MMEVVKLVEIFKNSLDNKNHLQTEKQLDEIHKIIGFLPTVLHICMESNIELPVRQAAVIYLKNQVMNYWCDKEPDKDGKLFYSIHEQDRALIRSSIVDAIIFSPDIIRKNLAISLNYIIKYDFPERWTGIVEKIVIYLQSSEPNQWIGALIAMLNLAKNYEYKSNFEKAPLLDAMKLLGPIIYKLMVDLMPDNSEQAVLMQKTILKIIFIVTQYSLPLTLFTREYFTQWMEIIRQVLDRPVPNQVNCIDVEERYELPWYKAKKWALHIIVRIFERYGPSKTLQKEYKVFATWYIKTFSLGLIQVILKVLDQFSQNIYLPSRIVQQCIHYLTTCVEHLFTWKILKPHISQIIEKVIFPLMCYTDEDDELWSTDPQEYVRKKFDIFEDYVSPVNAAQGFISACCKKRKDMLKDTISFAVQILSSDSSGPRFRDGALHMLGCVSDILLKKKIYHQQIDDMLSHYVFPYFKCEHSFLRARAAWVLHFFEDFEFDNDSTLNEALNCLQNVLINDQELPVKVQAAISLQTLVSNQEKSRTFVEANINSIILECLNLVKLSQNDDVTNGLQRLICVFGEKILPISVQVIDHLVSILESLLQQSGNDNEATITIMGLLNTIDTVLMLVEKVELLQQLEPYAMKGVLLILDQNLSELYEECFNVVTTLTDRYISTDMWKIYEYIFKIATKEDGIDYFADIMPAIHNFLTDDKFISDPNRIIAFFEICKYVLKFDCIEDTHCNAVKLIEVFFLQFRTKIENYVPSFCELVINRLMSDGMRTEELRNLCIQVILVVLYINSSLFFQIIDKLQQLYPQKNLPNYLIEEWLKNLNTFYGLHDRKVFILIFSMFLTLEPNKRPAVFNDLAPKYITQILTLFENLKEAYKAKANADADSSDSDTDYSISSDEEDAADDDDNVKGNLENLVNNLKQKLPFDVTEMDDENLLEDAADSDDDDDDEESDDENELTALENFETTIDKEDSNDDEYILFRKAVELLKQHDQLNYNLLFGNLTPAQITILEEIFVLAQRRQDAAESRKIEQGGGYYFSNQTVPSTFNFGGNFSLNHQS